MDNINRIPPGARQAALVVIDLLQQAHFAARGLEGYVTVDPKNRLVDRIHAARLLAEQLRSA